MESSLLFVTAGGDLDLPHGGARITGVAPRDSHLRDEGANGTEDRSSLPSAEPDAAASAPRAIAGRSMLFEVLYPFVLDGEVKHLHMFVDIDDNDTGMRLLAIGAVVEVQARPGRTD